MFDMMNSVCNLLCYAWMIPSKAGTTHEETNCRIKSSRQYETCTDLNFMTKHEEVHKKSTRLFPKTRHHEAIPDAS